MGKVPKGAFGIFGGPGAKTADKAALKLAKEMAEGGADRKEIWDATGWFKGVDDKWRFEIDDSKSMFRGIGTGEGSRAGQAIHHPDLYEAYPSLEDTRVRPMPGRGGSYEDVGVGTVYLGADEGASTHNTALLEMQHALQGREGFAAGGTPDRGWKRDEMFAAAQRSYEDAKFGAHSGMSDDELLAELTGSPIPETSAKPWAELTDRQRLEWLENGRDRLYRSLSGETEARNVERRAHMTPDERRATPPWETADVPEADQIVRFDAGQMNSELPMDEASLGLVKLTDEDAAKLTPEQRLDIAQKNAALPVEQGGLGLPPDNTQEMRAQAMGFDAEPLYHGTKSDIEAFEPSRGGEFGFGVYTARDPNSANMFASFARGNTGENIIPVISRAKNPLVTADRNIPRGLGRSGMARRGYDSVEGIGATGQTQTVVIDPAMLRSRFAAFDPARSDSADLLAANPEIGAMFGLLYGHDTPEQKPMTEKLRRALLAPGVI
jgi:hypothetical protein